MSENKSLSDAQASERGYCPSIREHSAHPDCGNEVEKLRAQILQAFVDIPRPKITLHVARALDDEWTISEERGDELRNLDPEETWQEVSKEKTEAFQEYFTFSDDEGWKFDFPAFMMHYLSEFPDYGYDAVVIAAIRKTYISILNEAQLTCLDDFLALCLKYEDHEMWLED